MPGRTRRMMAGEFDGVSGADFQMRIAVEFDKFNRGAEQRRGFFRFGDSLLRRAMSAGFAARTNDKMRLASGAGFRAR